MTTGRRIWITGIGIVTACGIGVDGFRAGLRAARSPVKRIDRFDPSPFRSQVAAQVDDFDPLAFMPADLARRMDRFSQMGMAAGRMALDDARFAPGSDGAATPERVGIYLGSALGGIAYAESQHERMVTALVKVPATEAQTTWYLMLDTDTLAVRGGTWLDPAWFAPDGDGRLPAYIASPWGYTKPVDAIAKMEAWGDTVAELRKHRRLDIPFDAMDDRVRHPRMISWCLFGNTAWTREVAAYAPGRLPVPADDTYLFYCAARRGDHTVHVRMSEYGWEHISRFHRLKSRCLEVMRGEP